MGKILVNLCLSDIPKDYIKEVTFSNGEKKKYINIVVSEMKETDAKGNDYTVYAYKPKEHKDDSTTWLGKGKLMLPKDGGEHTPSNGGTGTGASGDDLPF